MNALHRRVGHMGSDERTEASARRRTTRVVLKALALGGLPATLLLAGGLPAAPRMPQGPSSPIALAASADGTTIFVAEATGAGLAVFDTATDKVVRKLAL